MTAKPAATCSLTSSAEKLGTMYTRRDIRGVRMASNVLATTTAGVGSSGLTRFSWVKVRMRASKGPPPTSSLERASCCKTAKPALPAMKKKSVVRSGDRPAQEGAGEDADGGEDHGLEPDAGEAAQVVRPEAAFGGQQVQVFLGHAEVLVGAQAAQFDGELATGAGQDAGGQVSLVVVVFADVEEVAMRGHAGAGAGGHQRGADGLAQRRPWWCGRR